MKKAVKQVLLKISFGEWVVKIYGRLKLKFYYGLFKGREKLFTDFYHINQWSDNESVSGPGSTLNYTENLRKELPKLFEEFGIKRFLDAPCGDFNWFKQVSMPPDFIYTGADIVAPIVERNQQLYSSGQISFTQLDLTTDKLPNADLWLCRDCLIHLSNKDIFKVLENFLNGNIDFILTTAYTESNKNVNIPSGSHRYLNLELPPFNFCKPLFYIDDWIEGHPVKKIGLWRKESLLKILEKAKA